MRRSRRKSVTSFRPSGRKPAFPEDQLAPAPPLPRQWPLQRTSPSGLVLLLAGAFCLLHLRRTPPQRLPRPGFLVVGVGGVFIPRQPSPRIVGTLPRVELLEITGIVRSGMRHDIFPGFSWESIKEFPSSLREHWSDRILSIMVETNGTVEVETGVVRGPLNGRGTIYKFKKGPTGWQVKEIGFWVSSLSDPGNRVAGRVFPRGSHTIRRRWSYCGTGLTSGSAHGGSWRSTWTEQHSFSARFSPPQVVGPSGLFDSGSLLSVLWPRLTLAPA